MHVTCKARDVCIVWDHPARTNRTSSPCSTQKIAHSAPGLLPPHSKKKKKHQKSKSKSKWEAKKPTQAYAYAPSRSLAQ